MNEELEKHSIPIIHLFKGILYDSNEFVWKSLLQQETHVRNYFAIVGLELIINEAEGFAFLKQKVFSEEITANIPKLVEKRQLSFPVSILAILLRKKLLEFDNKGNDSRLVLKKSDIVELLISFLPNNTSNEKRIIDKIDTHITRLIELGFLRELKNEENYYEVSRILIAYMPVEELQLTLDKLNEYKKNVGANEE
mgnify:FL=1|jgi:hypothetical protein